MVPFCGGSDTFGASGGALNMKVPFFDTFAAA